MPPRFVPSLFTVLRLCFQYRRHTTKAAKCRWSSTLAAASDCRNDRIGTFVDSHHVGDPNTTRSYSRSVTVAEIPSVVELDGGTVDITTAPLKHLGHRFDNLE